MRCKRKLFNRFIHHLPLTSSTFDADLHDDMEAAKPPNVKRVSKIERPSTAYLE